MQPNEATSQSTIDWLTVTEAAAHLKVKPRTLLTWAKRGQIKGRVLSGTKRVTWRFLREELDMTLGVHCADRLQ